MTKELLFRIMSKALDLYTLSELNRKIHGDSFVEFSNRSIRVIVPKELERGENK